MIEGKLTLTLKPGPHPLSHVTLSTAPAAKPSLAWACCNTTARKQTKREARVRGLVLEGSALLILALKMLTMLELVQCLTKVKLPLR